MRYTIRYAKAKANRAHIWLKANQSQIPWNKGDNIVIYKPHTIINGSV